MMSCIPAPFALRHDSFVISHILDSMGIVVCTSYNLFSQVISDIEHSLPASIQALYSSHKIHYSFRIFDFSLSESFLAWCLISEANRSLFAFLSTRRDCFSALTACLRSFLSSFDSFLSRDIVTWTAMQQ